MSSTVFTAQNPSPVQTRRMPMKNSDRENNPQQQNNRRSLSGKFRNLFRKNSSSPTRSMNNNEQRSPPAPVRRRSPSPEPIRAATEAPHLRAPTVPWPFGKKKAKLTASTSEKTKRKVSRKSKQTAGATIQISSPVYEQEHQTDIRGQNFVPRTPELTHNSTGRTQSLSSYEIPTKGFRDYAILDNSRSSQQVIPPDVDVILPPPYIPDHSRSPSLNHQSFPDTNIEHSYHRNTSIPVSETENIPISKQQHTVGNTSSLTATQMLIENNPVRSPSVTQTTDMIINSDRQKNTSHSSLHNTESRSRTSSSMDLDIPKLNAPLIPLSSGSSKNRSKRTNSQSTYNSTSTMTNSIQPHQSLTNTYTSLPDTSTGHNGSFTPLKPPKSSLNKYPTLSAIVEHHLRPTSVHFNQPSPPSPQRTQRFDTSTATFNDYDQRQQWSTIITDSLPSSTHHDGYIRPFTPPKSSIPPDVSTIQIDLDDLHGRAPPSHYTSLESPIIYRSTTTIYTRDKSKYADRGELRTWSIPGTDDNDSYKKPSTSIQILPARIVNEYQYTIGANENEYSNNRYSENNLNHSNLTQSLITDEREKIGNQSTRSYQITDHTQESLKPKTSEVAVRHYALKRTDSYDGLGILISTDAQTRLNHRIRDVETGSPGARVGLQKNDRIINVNSTNVENMEFGDVLVLIKQGLTNNNLQFSVRNE